MSIAGYKTQFMVGAYVTRGTWKGQVRGHAKGRDGQDCLCVQVCGKAGMDGSHWKTWLWPESECKAYEPKPESKRCADCGSWVRGVCWRMEAFGVVMPKDGFCSYWFQRSSDE